MNFLENVSKLSRQQPSQKQIRVRLKGNQSPNGPYQNKVQVNMPGVVSNDKNKNSNSSISVADSNETLSITPGQDKLSQIFNPAQGVQMFDRQYSDRAHSSLDSNPYLSCFPHTVDNKENSKLNNGSLQDSRPQPTKTLINFHTVEDISTPSITQLQLKTKTYFNYNPQKGLPFKKKQSNVISSPNGLMRRADSRKNEIQKQRKVLERLQSERGYITSQEYLMGAKAEEGNRGIDEMKRGLRIEINGQGCSPKYSRPPPESGFNTISYNAPLDNEVSTLQAQKKYYYGVFNTIQTSKSQSSLNSSRQQNLKNQDLHSVTRKSHQTLPPRIIKTTDQSSDKRQVSVKIPRESDRAPKGEKCLFNIGQERHQKAIIHQQEFSFNEAKTDISPQTAKSRPSTQMNVHGQIIKFRRALKKMNHDIQQRDNQDLQLGNKGAPLITAKPTHPLQQWSKKHLKNFDFAQLDQQPSL